MNLRRYRRAIEKLYEDKCTISRYGPVKQPNGSTKHELYVVYTDMPCRISQKSLGANGQTESANTISYETKLFISPDIEVKQGDTIKVTRGTLEHLYTAGEPFPYQTHQELSIQRSVKA
ncbi:ABC transporter ATP-binding protein [Paenibacillus antarcticus]|uniref:ABC transporter ATP-binding protein n=1 Tax=Paenibacillus antarcticus TaxID=253703 RepID=A0A168P9X1_9BACL|nr:ABC transporter ATP-binding protein [Paenibacillus antarcticus]OAB46547.1 ABC transporter ATP-binding protein [Paenibacillus antarcticus]